MQFGHEFVLHQRTREIATKGFSTIAVPKAGKAPPATKIEPAILQIQRAIDSQEESLSNLGLRIHHTVRLMECLNGKNDAMAISTMHKIRSIQYEYVHVLRVIEGLKAYEKHVKLGLMSPKNPEKMIKELQNVPWKNKPCTAGKDALDAMIEKQQYFPVMSRDGKITFSEKVPSSSGYETASTRSSSAASSTSGVSSRKSYSAGTA